MMQKQELNKTQEQLELENFRETGEVFYDPADEEFMDFSKVDQEPIKEETKEALNNLLKNL